jgi:hypothetical protein
MSTIGGVRYRRCLLLLQADDHEPQLMLALPRLPADAPHGRTVADLLAHGFTNAVLDRLARDGLATFRPGTTLR